MNKTSSVLYFIRKSPILRTLLWVAIILFFSAVSIFVGLHIKKSPEIISITPPVGSPGDLVVISGVHFGNIKDTSYVEFGGSRLTSSSYMYWSDSEIKVILPPDIQEGLVYVCVKNSLSKPSFFANANTAPVAVSDRQQSNLPIITSIAPSVIYPGSLITITGINFGISRDNAKVYFSMNRERPDYSQDIQEDLKYLFTSCDESNFDYEYWSDSEIRVYVPDGSISGSVYVENSRGISKEKNIFINEEAGTKSFIFPKTYIVQVSADVENDSNDKDSSIIIRMPIPAVNASQLKFKVVESSPEPIIQDFQKTAIFQVPAGKAVSSNKFFQNFAVTVYETRTNIQLAKIKNKTSERHLLEENALKADSCIPSDNNEIKLLAASIIKNEKNPYTKAQLIYNYVTENYKPLKNMRTIKESPLELINSKKGDAYDFAVIFTALLRAAGVPALPNSGILVNSEIKAKNHWWSEFYIAGFGWIPCDPSLGAGLEYQSWNKNKDVKQYYFGNLDGQHILFSRGWNEIKPGSPGSKTVSRAKSFALQSIWEEASGKNIKYSSYWADPVIIGVY